mgnify:CR=1 FL=1
MVVNGCVLPDAIVHFAERYAVAAAKADIWLTAGELTSAIKTEGGPGADLYADRLADRVLTKLKRKGHIEFDRAAGAWRAKS